MNKATLIEVVGRVVSTRKEALAAVDAMLGAIQHTLQSGEKVVLAGIGTFHVKMRKAKIGRNPKTGQTVPIPPRRAVRFKISKDLFPNATAASYNEDRLRPEQAKTAEPVEGYLFSDLGEDHA